MICHLRAVNSVYDPASVPSVPVRGPQVTLGLHSGDSGTRRLPIPEGPDEQRREEEFTPFARAGDGGQARASHLLAGSRPCGPRSPRLWDAVPRRTSPDADSSGEPRRMHLLQPCERRRI